MIKTKAEYEAMRQRVVEERERFAVQRAALADAGLTPEQVEVAMQPLVTFAMQLEAELDFYERMMRGDLSALRGLRSIGKHLIALRVSSGWSQAELARRLGVSASQVSRDERDEYFGATVEKVQRVLDALGFEGHFEVVPKVSA